MANAQVSVDDAMPLPATQQNVILPVQYVQLTQATEPASTTPANAAPADTKQLDPLTRQRLRDLGEDVQVEVLPDGPVRRFV